VRGRWRIASAAGLLIAHDGPLREQPDHVGGPYPAARTLAALTVREPVARALDVGAGSGLQALLASRHADRVVATDVNPRALELTELNARLNGCANVETRPGSFFEPVHGDRFGLVVSNPPFVISPDTSFVFRDAGGERDGVSRDVVRGAAAALEDGGHATVLCNWIVDGDAWLDPVAGWLDGCACQAIVLHHATVDVVEYASTWNAQLDDPSRAAALDRWLAFYRREGVDAIASGAVVLRRREPAWTAAFEMPATPRGDGGAHLRRMFAAQDTLRRSDVAELRLRPVAAHVLEQGLRFDDGGYTIAGAAMRLPEGAAVVGEVDPAAIQALFRLDGTRTVAEATTDDAERAALVATARGLFERGFLELAAG
jgi:SAM-dependent methyltransferase